MNINKERLIGIIDEMSEKEVNMILAFAEYVKTISEKDELEGLTRASETSLGFWDNDIDDKIWNNV